MRHIDEYRDPEQAKRLAAAIAHEANPARSYRLMEFCGGHTHAIYRYGLQDLLPHNVIMVHGPGCPVCVLPTGRLDMAIRMAQIPDIIFCSYADMVRVPGAHGKSLLKVKATGADIRMVYSTTDALNIAQENPTKQVIFFAIGFETTTPPTALAIKSAATQKLKNFTVFVNHVLTPAAIAGIFTQTNESAINIDGLIGPSHVSVVIGTKPYEPLATRFQRPIVVAGFEPVDVLQAVLMLIRQINENRTDVENQYIRAVNTDGNAKAQALMTEVFTLREHFEWRGLGQIEKSALQLAPAFCDFDAEKRFDIPYIPTEETKSCACPEILRGQKRPSDCKLFGRICTPETPYGACMVSTEGACAAHYTYGRFREVAAQ